jgi:signal transduction histidine kinase
LSPASFLPGTVIREGKTTRLLIVDDEVPQMRALCDTLREHGYETTGFTAAAPALAALRDAPFDLLLSDLMMPEMNGVALLQAALETQPDLVGIIMTGEGTIATAVEAMKVGALDYILKPFKLSVILPVLSRALEMRRLKLENAELDRCLRDHAARLEAANGELEAFSYSVSHELRAPLLVINGFARILVEDHAAQLQPEARRLLENVIAGGERMERLIADLLEFSRLSRQPLTKRAVDMVELVQVVLDELRAQQPERNVEVRVGTLPTAMGDPALLKQVFVNLLSNAFKFTRTSVQASVEVGYRQEAGTTIYFVRDNGVGFDMDNAKKLFGVFQRLHGIGKFEGTGIGLSIVQRIVQRHGGRVWAEANVDHGALFQFTVG